MPEGRVPRRGSPAPPAPPPSRRRRRLAAMPVGRGQPASWLLVLGAAAPALWLRRFIFIVVNSMRGFQTVQHIMNGLP